MLRLAQGHIAGGAAEAGLFPAHTTSLMWASLYTPQARSLDHPHGPPYTDHLEEGRCVKMPRTLSLI